MPSLLLAALVLSGAIFALVWFVCLRIRNYSFLDVTWTYMIGLLALLGLIVASASGPWLLIPLVGIVWSLRLGTFVLRRVMRHHPEEDKRYRTLRERWPTPLAFLLFFELQAVIAVIFAVPFLLASRADGGMGPFGWTGLAIAVAGIGGETLADLQSGAFKRRARRPAVLDTGLWRYSRHPNYFFELLFWIGVAVSVLPLPYGWTGLACPLMIAYFLLRVTGIPVTEKHSLESHGEAYRDYQRRTSVFVPWFPKRSGSGAGPGRS